MFNGAATPNLPPPHFFRTLKAMGRILSVTLLLAVSCFAQQSARPAAHSGYTGFGQTGFGAPPGGLSSTSFGAPSGSVRRGMGYGRGGYAHRQLIAPIYVGVPIYGGYGYADAYGPDYGGDVPSDAPPMQAAPSVIINQNFVPERANPMVREVPEMPDSDQQGSSFQAPGPPPGEPAPSDNAAPAASDDPIIYLIAFRDHSIVPALAYWVEGHTVKYVNMDHSLNQASLELIDRDMSMLLNKQRKVEFRLPAR